MDDSSDDETYCCPCGRQFKRKATYSRHMDIAHSSSESHKCRICSKTFGNANTLKMHMNIHQDSKTDDKIERLTRSRKNRTPSGGRDKTERSGERMARMKSPNAKRDRSKSKESVKPAKDLKPTPKKLKVGNGDVASKVDTSVAPKTVANVNKDTNSETIKVKNMENQKVSEKNSEIVKMMSVDQYSVKPQEMEMDSAILPTVVIKQEPLSPLDSSVNCEESASMTISPSAKENVLPLTALGIQGSSTDTSDKVITTATPAMKNMVLQAAESPKVPVSILLEKDKVRLIDSTNTSRLPLQDPKNAPSTIIIKLEDSEKHCQTTEVPKTSAPVIPGHSQNAIVSTTSTTTAAAAAAAAAIKAGQNGILSHTSQTPLFVQVAESLTSQTLHQGFDIKPLIEHDEGHETDDDNVNVRKSTRLRGKTPGWRSWLEEDEMVLSGPKGIRRRRMSKVKLEGEDYDIIQQVVDMTSGGFPEEDHPELPTTLASPTEMGSQHNKRCREVTKTVFACPVCSKEFFSEKYLSMHMSLHRGNGADVPSPPGVEEDEPPVKKTKPSVNGSGAHWTCKICNKTFAQNSNFKNHIRTHSDERPFVCDICCIGFKERYHLKKHMLFKHSNELKEECRVCGKKFKDSTAVRAHERIHSDVRPYACRRCGKTFKTSECLWHHENRSKTCGVALDGIQAPASRFRRGRQPRKSPEQSPPIIKTENKTETVHFVPQPPQLPQPQPTTVRQQHSLLQMHTLPAVRAVENIPTTVQALEAATAQKPSVQMLAQQNIMQVTAPLAPPRLLQPPTPVMLKVQPESPSPIINASIDPQLPVVKVEQEIELPDYDLTGLPSDSSVDDSSQDADLHELFGSDEDTDEIDSPMSFENMDIGTDGEQFSPDGDQEDGFKIPAMVSSPDLTTMCCEALEIKTDSQGKKRYLCTKCGKQFASPAAFEKHMVTHSEMRPYKCNICDIGFKLKVHLKKHNLYRHSNEYPCECSICGKKFKDSSAVRLHERIHSTDRPFKCECGKSFKTRENLWGHRHRGPCEKNKDLIMQSKMYRGLLSNTPMDAHAKFGDTHVSAHASILDNQIIAHAVVSNNKVTAKATIGDNGEVTASALIHGPRISARASVNGNDGTAHAKVGEKEAAACYPPVPAAPVAIPETVVELQAKEDGTKPATSCMATSGGHAQAITLPTAVVAPIKKVMATVPPHIFSSPPAKVSAPLSVVDKGLPPFETFAPTIMSALQKPPRLPPGVTLPHLANTQQSNTSNPAAMMAPPLSTSSIAEKCPTIQKYLQQNRPTTTRLPGIQQLFQSHSLAHALKNRNNGGLPPSSPVKSHCASPIRAPGTPPAAIRNSSSPFTASDLHLPPPPPYPGNPNLGGPANADFRAKTPSSMDSTQSPASLPLVYWDEDSGSDKKAITIPWHSEAESLFHELANSPAFGQL